MIPGVWFGCHVLWISIWEESSKLTHLFQRAGPGPPTRYISNMVNSEKIRTWFIDFYVMGWIAYSTCSLDEVNGSTEFSKLTHVEMVQKPPKSVWQLIEDRFNEIGFSMVSFIGNFGDGLFDNGLWFWYWGWFITTKSSIYTPSYVCWLDSPHEYYSNQCHKP